MWPEKSPSGRIESLPPDGDGEGWRLVGERKPSLVPILFGLVFAGSGLVVILSSAGEPLAVVFILPFLMVGIAALIFGLFLGFGDTEIRLSHSRCVRRQRLFGFVRERAIFNHNGIQCRLTTSHLDDGKRRLKLVIESDSGKSLCVGGTLSESDLRWFYQKISESQGKTFDPTADLDELEFSTYLNPESIEPVVTRTLTIRSTGTGFEILSRSRGGFLCLFMAGFFSFCAYCMTWGVPDFISDQISRLGSGTRLTDGEGSFGPLPVAFALGSLVVFLVGLGLLSFRKLVVFKFDRLSVRHSHFGIGMTKQWPKANLDKIVHELTGHSEGDARYVVKITSKHGGKGPTLCSFRSAEEAGAIVSWAKRWLEMM